MNRDDLVVILPDPCGKEDHARPYRPVSDADLAEMGYVKVQETTGVFEEYARVWAEDNGYVKVSDCEACEGTGVGCILYDEWRLHRRCGLANDPCPSCQGSGKGRLVNLTGEGFRLAMHSFSGGLWQFHAIDGPEDGEPTHIAFPIAALDKGETE